ncbi:MAG: hypothetical protein FJ265_01350 [Planctomycetes bacterium]|nr:hypothetical protein [Planctomycetota bacterium]
MIPHPLALAVLGCDLAALLLLLFAGWIAARIAAGWQPGAATQAQLRLERQAEVARLAGHAAALLVLLGTLVLVVLVASVLPALVPGAMCGTGVLQATAGRGERALALRLLALSLLGAFRLFARLDDHAVRSPLLPTVARLLLLAVPVAVLAGLDTARALAALDVHRPVDCCALVYGQLRAEPAAPASPAVAPWVVASLAAAGALLLAALAVLGRSGVRSPLRTGLLALAALGFAPIAALALVRVWAAYHYGVLQHHCPWCLFLGRHGLAGYPLFLAILLVLGEGPAAWLAQQVGRRHPELAAPAAARARRAAWGALAGLALYTALAFGPALLWRWRHCVWLHG